MTAVSDAISAAVSSSGEQVHSPIVRLWDANWNLRFCVDTGWRIDQPDVLALPLNHEVARWLLELPHAEFDECVYLTVDTQGRKSRRWLGRLDSFSLTDVGGFFGRHVVARFLPEQ